MHNSELLQKLDKLLNAYSDKAPIIAILYAPEEQEYLLTSSNGRMLLFNSAAIMAKSTKNTQGVAVMTQKRGHRLLKVEPYADGMLMKPHRYRTRTLPSAGSYMQAEEQGEQLML
jgi:DNA gyrase subunit A